MDVRGIENVNTKLLPLQAVSKDLGIPKSGVQALIDNRQLIAVDIGGKPYITTASLFSLLRQNSPVNFGIEDNRYPAPEEVSCVLTKKEVGKTQEKAGAAMEYKGSISTLKDGRFMVQIDKGRKLNGKRDRESKGFRDEGDAKYHLEKRLSELNGKSLFVPPVPQIQPIPQVPSIPQGQYTPLTFEEYAIKVLNEGVGKATTRTIEGYRRGLAPVVKYIGETPMVDITQQDLKKMFEKMRSQYVKSNLKKSFNTVKLLVDIALEKKHIPIDIMWKMKCPTSTKPIKNLKYPTYSDQDIEVLFEKSKEWNVELYTMFTVLECTGMRPGELRALEWSSLNVEEKTIRICQAVTFEFEDLDCISKAPKSKAILSVTKSASGLRKLPLSDKAISALLEWQKRLSKSRNHNLRDSAFIFPDRKGSFKSETACQCMVQRFRKEYKLDSMGVTFYKFRHTMCTRLILDGQPISVIQIILGDNTPDVITNIYTHINEEMALKATKGFYDNLNKKHQETT